MRVKDQTGNLVNLRYVARIVPLSYDSGHVLQAEYAFQPYSSVLVYSNNGEVIEKLKDKIEAYLAVGFEGVLDLQRVLGDLEGRDPAADLELEGSEGGQP